MYTARAASDASEQTNAREIMMNWSSFIGTLLVLKRILNEQRN